MALRKRWQGPPFSWLFWRSCCLKAPLRGLLAPISTFPLHGLLPTCLGRAEHRAKAETLMSSSHTPPIFRTCTWHSASNITLVWASIVETATGIATFVQTKYRTGQQGWGGWRGKTNFFYLVLKWLQWHMWFTVLCSMKKITKWLIYKCKKNIAYYMHSFVMLFGLTQTWKEQHSIWLSMSTFCHFTPELSNGLFVF